MEIRFWVTDNPVVNKGYFKQYFKSTLLFYESFIL